MPERPCVHCHEHTGDPARRGLCDGCYSSPARGLYDAAGRRVDTLPAPRRQDDDEDGSGQGQYARGTRHSHRRL